MLYANNSKKNLSQISRFINGVASSIRRGGGGGEGNIHVFVFCTINLFLKFDFKVIVHWERHCAPVHPETIVSGFSQSYDVEL